MYIRWSLQSDRYQNKGLYSSKTRFESFTDHFADRANTRKLVARALRDGRRHLSNREARRVICDYGINTIETVYCDDVEEVLEVFAVERRPIDVTVIHEDVCYPFLDLSPTQRRCEMRTRYCID